MFFSITKNEIIYSLLISSFEQIKKNLDKTDKNYITIQTVCDNLNQSKKIITEGNNLEKYSLILVQTLDDYKCTNKILEIIIKAYEEIINDNLVDEIILQKITPVLLNNINRYLKQNEINNKLSQKILVICESIYNNETLFIHHNNFKTILEICINISSNEKENNNNKSIVYKTFISLENKILNNLNININNPCIGGVSFAIKNYIDYLVDLIEIQSYIKDNNKNIINKYINIIQNHILYNNNKNNELEKEIELLYLDKLDIYKNKNNKIGKYGWCIICGNSSNIWSQNLNFPICNTNDCEKKLVYMFSNNLYYIDDYFMMISFLSKIKCNNIKTIELCLEINKDMLNKTIQFFKNDKSMIEMIKDIFKDLIIKNALSQNIKIFQLSIDIFNLIYINYRRYLKEQIELFFMKIFIGLLESEKKPFNYKDIIIDNLNFLLEKIGHNFFIEIYINYDCDSNFNAIFCVLINLFIKIRNGLFQQNKYTNTFKNINEINIITNKIFELLNKFIFYLNDYLTKITLSKNTKNDNENNKSYNELVSYLYENKNISSEESFNIMKNTYIEDFNNNTIKDDYSDNFIKEKNDKNSNNNLINFIINTRKEKLINLNYNDYSSYEMAYFIIKNRKNVEKNYNINSILYSDTNEKVLFYFIKIISNNFKNKNILESLRILFSYLPYTENEKMLNNIFLIFAENYKSYNKSIELKNINTVYYISFFLFKLSNYIHRENKHNISLENFIEEINQYYNGNINKENKNLYECFENFYNEIIKEPIKFCDCSSEKEKINFEIEENNKNIYITNINNNDIKKFIEFSYNHFLYIYSQSINESIKKLNRELFFNCINKILVFSKICRILNSEKAQEIYLNIVISMINLNEKAELNETIIELIINLMNYINNNCQYIKCNWNKILQMISLLEYYLLEPENNIILNLRNSQKEKFTEKEIKIFLNKRDNLSLNISDAICESIFSKTELFENEVIIRFINDLCQVSKFELDSYYIPRLFSLKKLVEIAHFNIFRSAFYWKKIWKIISQYLGDIIINYSQENIWKQALDSLKQILIKLLEKEEYLNQIYMFQENIFFVFEKIINSENIINLKKETLFDVLYFIVAQYGKNINYGWKNIFKIIKTALNLKNSKINESIINILKYIDDNSKNIFMNNNIEIFEYFIKCLFIIYSEKSMKQYSFEIIIGILEKIIDEENSGIIMPSSNKIFDFIKLFFYNLDNLMKINIIEYLNLLFEVINHNKKILLSKNLNIFIYIYITYFKPNISILLLSQFENRLSLLNSTKCESNNIYNYLVGDTDNYKENKIIQRYIEQFINLLINDFKSKEGKEYEEIFYENDDKNKNKLCGFLNEIKYEINEDNNKFENYINNRINDIQNIEENNYELYIKYFLEKFKSMFISQENGDKDYIKYNYFYDDLILTIQQLSILNINSVLIYRILFKIISSSIEDISISTKNKLIENNICVLKLISLSKIDLINEKEIFKFIKYSLDFSNYYLDFIQIIYFDFKQSFELISKIFNNILLLDLENNNNLEKYKIINSSSTIDLLMKLQDLKLYIINKTSKENIIKLKNPDKFRTIIYLNKIYEKYNINNEENSLMNKIYIFELENIIPKFTKLLSDEELDNTYQCLINLIGSINHNIRNGAKNILKLFVNDELIFLHKKEK